MAVENGEESQYRLEGVKVRCNSDICKWGGEEEEGISNDSQDLVLYSWMYVSDSTLVGKTEKEVWSMCGLKSRIQSWTCVSDLRYLGDISVELSGRQLDLFVVWKRYLG